VGATIYQSRTDQGQNSTKFNATFVKSTRYGSAMNDPRALSGKSPIKTVHVAQPRPTDAVGKALRSAYAQPAELPTDLRRCMGWLDRLD
jgi:hypothetical protein